MVDGENKCKRVVQRMVEKCTRHEAKKVFRSGAELLFADKRACHFGCGHKISPLNSISIRSISSQWCR